MATEFTSSAIAGVVQPIPARTIAARAIRFEINIVGAIMSDPEIGPDS
jgi:hypothetical protein